MVLGSINCDRWRFSVHTPFIEKSMVGSTIRNYHSRTSEHDGTSPCTGVLLSSPPHTMIRQHIMLCDTPNCHIWPWPCFSGIIMQPTFALVRVVRGNLLRDINCPVPPAYCMFSLLPCNEAYEIGEFGTGSC